MSELDTIQPGDIKSPGTNQKGVNKMNSTSTLEQFVVKGKGVTVQGRVLSTIIITTILFVGIIAYAAVSSGLQGQRENALVSDNDPVYHLREGYASDKVAPQINPIFFLKEGYAAWD